MISKVAVVNSLVGEKTQGARENNTGVISCLEDSNERGLSSSNMKAFHWSVWVVGIRRRSTRKNAEQQWGILFDILSNSFEKYRGFHFGRKDDFVVEDVVCNYSCMLTIEVGHVEIEVVQHEAASLIEFNVAFSCNSSNCIPNSAISCHDHISAIIDKFQNIGRRDASKVFGEIRFKALKYLPEAEGAKRIK